MEQRQCLHCRTRFTLLRNPDQRYCPKPACQKKRECRYKRKKLRSDADYKQNKRDAQKRWCNKHPDYWKEYRARKPEYVESNRLAQQRRNKQRSSYKARTGPSGAIAKIPPLTPETYYSSITYQLILLSFALIAKRVPYRQEDSSLLAF